MSAPTTTPTLSVQSFYSSTLSSSIVAGDTVIPLNAVPTGTEGFLVLDGDNSSREIIYYTSKGASSVTCPSAALGRGQGGTTAASHSSGATVKMNFVDQHWSELQNGNALGVGSITATKVAVGMPVQMVATNSATQATGTGVIPSDDTIPQITEGDQYMTQAITPKSATNILVIETIIHCSFSVTASIIVALFQDSTANALAANSVFQQTGTGRVTLTLSHTMVAGTTSATTFRARAGGSTAGTFTLNGTGGA